MAGTIIGAVAAPLVGGMVSSLFGGGGSGGSGQRGAQQAAQAADPFGGQRGQYQQQLSNLMSGKTQYEMQPGAQFAMNQGLDAIGARNRAQGRGNSGGEQIDLAKYATGFAGQQYQQEISNLMAMSGVGSGAPGQAGQIMADQSASAANGLNTFAGGLGNAIVGSDAFGNMFGGSNAGQGGGGATDMTGFYTPAPWQGNQQAPQTNPFGGFGGGGIGNQSFGDSFGGFGGIGGGF